jgi:DNA-binding NarL/FixJ family response regulator
LNPLIKRKIKILIAEENQFVRKGLAEVIEVEKECRIIGDVSTGNDLVTEYFLNTPDLMIINIILPGMNGIEAYGEIRSRDSRAKVLFTSNYNDQVFVYMAHKCGGMGYYFNDESPRHVINYIKEIYSGNYCFPDNLEEIKVRYLDKKEYTGYENQELQLILSRREYEIFLLCGKGLTSREISDNLQISQKTVEFHLHNIKGKLNLKNRVQLISISAKHSLLYNKIIT